MGAILAGIVAAVVIAIGAGIYMTSEQEPAWQVYTSESTRVGDPGSNLVGSAWTGINRTPDEPGEDESEGASS